MSPITVSVMRLLFVVSTALVFFAGYQFGRDHQRFGLFQCGSMRSTFIQSIADVQRMSPPSATGAVPSGGMLITTSAADASNCAQRSKPASIPTSSASSSSSSSSPEVTCPAPADESRLWTMHMGRATVPEDVFAYLHHPASPAKYNYFLARQAARWDKTMLQVEDMPCRELYLTRTGSRASQPNKCVAVVPVPEGHASLVQQSIRRGYTALNTDQYQQDYPRNYNSRMNSEPELLRPLLENLPELIALMRRTLGDRKHATILVANAGVLDLLLNFVCSAEAAGIDLASVVVFVGDDRMVQLVRRMGISAIYAPALGAMPLRAAGSYLDGTFSRMMWFKAAAVYVTLMAGYEVLFQDVDLVWLMDPMSYFAAQPHYDLFFMDDGARTPRYTPFFVNSGFYFVKHNARTVYLFEKLMKAAAAEIGQTHSHQSVLIRHIAESVHLFGVQVFVLDMDLFPSGQAYHENKPFVKKVQQRTFRPFVFHMCWTDNRENKLVYFKDVGLWLVSDSNAAQCQVNALGSGDRGGGGDALLDRCCERARYWPPPTAADFAATIAATTAKQTAARQKRLHDARRDLPFWEKEQATHVAVRVRVPSVVDASVDADGVADDGEADDKLEEEGDLSQLKARRQEMKRSKKQLEDGGGGVSSSSRSSNGRTMTMTTTTTTTTTTMSKTATAAAANAIEEEGDEEEGYGANVPLESFGTEASSSTQQQQQQQGDDDDNDDAAVDDDDDDDEGGDDDDDDNNDAEDDKYEDDARVAAPAADAKQ